MDDFLQGLRMSVDFGPIQPIDLARAAQLINKTNQFNTTTRRFTTEEVSALAAAPENITLQYRLIDRFGDNGLVSVMLLGLDAQDPQVFELLNWVMSCRVFGRQLEDAAMNIAIETARARGARRLCADLVATKKNAVINHLFADLGFERIEAAGRPDTTRWAVDLAKYQQRPTFISRGAST
jgi:FkbH-like protein